MRKLLGSLIVFLMVLFAFFPIANAHPYTTTFNFGGHVAYDSQGTLSINYPISDTGYYLTGGLLYNFDWNLPEWDVVYPWTLDIDVWASGQYDGTLFNEAYADTFDLPPFSLQDLVGGYSKQQVINFVKNNVPMSYYDPGLGGYYLEPGSDFQSGSLYFGLKQDLGLPIDYALVAFGGEINLTAVSAPVPEPATMLLLGSGLVGLVGFRRKFRKR